MKKYRLKKDIVLPDLIIPAGTISRNVGERRKGVWYHEFGYKGDVMGYSQQIIERYPEWFEEVNDESCFAKMKDNTGWMKYINEPVISPEPMKIAVTVEICGKEFTYYQYGHTKNECHCVTRYDLMRVVDAIRRNR